MRADLDVVTNLHEVVELDPVFDHGVFQRPAVDAGVGANFNIVANAHGPQLLDLFPAPKMCRKAKAIGPNHHARMQNAARANHAILTDRDAGLEPGLRPNDRPPLDHAQRTNDGRGVDFGLGVNHRTGMHTGRHGGLGLAPPPLGKAGKVMVGVIGHNAGATLAGQGLQGGGYDHRGRAGLGEERLVLGMTQKAQALVIGVLQRGETGDAKAGLPNQLATQGLDDLTEGYRHALTWRC